MPLLRFLLVAAMAISCLRPAQAQQNTLVSGREAPRFSLERLDGGRLELGDLRGRAVIVNFWATWCKPCRSEFADLISAWREADGALEIVAVNLTDQERKKDVLHFVEEFAVPFPVVLDRKGKVRELYSLVTLPTSVFVDSAGIVRRVHSGPLTRPALSQGLAVILPSP
jgi:peroxiredoxin